MSFVAVALGVGGLATGIIGGIASNSAASKQAGAANNAAQLQAQEAQNALDFQKQEWNTTQANEAPWLAAGKTDLSNLQAILAQPGQGWGKTFSAPTAAEAAAYPGYEFQVQQGEGALENSAAAKGALFSGNTEEALQRYGQQSAQSDYGNVYNQAFNEYLQNYGQYNNRLNRLAAVSGLGQTTASTLGSQGQSAASNVGGIDLTTGAQQGQDFQNAAAATASGYIGGANALSGGISSLTNLYALQQLLGGGGGGGGIPPVIPAGDAAIANSNPYGL